MSLHGSASRGPPSQSRTDDKTGDTGPILIGVGDDGAGERGAARVGRGDDMNQSQFADPNDRRPKKKYIQYVYLVKYYVWVCIEVQIATVHVRKEG